MLTEHGPTQIAFMKPRLWRRLAGSNALSELLGTARYKCASQKASVSMSMSIIVRKRCTVSRKQKRS